MLSIKGNRTAGQKGRFDFSIVILSAILFFTAAAIVFNYLVLTSQIDFIQADSHDANATSLLVVLEDDNKPLATYITLYYYKTRLVSVFDIPGNIGRIIKDINRVDRIDTVYDAKKLPPYVSELENLLGLQIDHTLVFELNALAKMVDILEGVRIFMPEAARMLSDGEVILFPSGWINLDGDKTKAYLRFEEEGADAESSRLRRERFFIGLVKKIGERNVYLKNDAIDKSVAALLKTNLNSRTRRRLFDDFARLDTDRISAQTISGVYREVSGKTLLMPHYDGGLVKDLVSQTLRSLTREDDRSMPERVITVEVLNGTNISGLAGRTAELIRGLGYDVISIANADNNNYAKTTIIDRLNHQQEIENFAQIINCDNIIEEAIDNFDVTMQSYEYKADFTLIIGRDYSGRFN